MFHFVRELKLLWAPVLYLHLFAPLIYCFYLEFFWEGYFSKAVKSMIERVLEIPSQPTITEGPYYESSFAISIAFYRIVFFLHSSSKSNDNSNTYTEAEKSGIDSFLLSCSVGNEGFSSKSQNRRK